MFEHSKGMGRMMMNLANACVTSMKTSAAFAAGTTSGFAFRRGISNRLPTATALITEPPEPVLMLEGDCFHLDQNGISRTAYLDRKSGMVLEEQYHLESARKIFMLRDFIGIDEGSKYHKNHRNTLHVGPSISGCKLQEIDYDNIFNGVGTGVTTWESSMAMAFYFLNHPEELNGDVLEIGSGVGLGGILTLKAAASRSFDWRKTLKSYTFSDGSRGVISQCIENLKEALDLKGIAPINIKEIDWNKTISKEDRQAYKTLIASDIIYMYPDVKPLARTINDLLHPFGTLHMFAPLHRSMIPKLVDELKEEYKFSVEKETFELDRLRLTPLRSQNNNFSERFCMSQISTSEYDSSMFASEEKSKFLHIMFRRDHDVCSAIGLDHLD